MGEKRKYERRRPSHYSAVFNRDTQKILGRLANLSTEGFMLVSEQPIGADQELRCRIILPEDMNAGTGVSFDAHTLWCRAGSAPGTFNTGLNFTHITLKDVELLEQLTRHPAFQH
jgi:hypothetical protein